MPKAGEKIVRFQFLFEKLEDDSLLFVYESS